MGILLVLAVLVPALGAMATRAAGRRAGDVAAVAALLAALPSWALLVGAATGSRARDVVTWLPAGGLDVGLRLDGLSALMTATVASVGLAVLVYSGGYFAREERAPTVLAGLLAFLAAMQGLALADGYLALLVFWELVGAASARLIAFSRDDPAAAPGAVRAFLTTRAADLGFYLALLALLAGTGTLAFGAARPAGALGALVGVGLLLAAMGKSAQAPLQTWLSGAMAGPTPVSALLHSATMVAAGVYLLARSAHLLAGWPLEVAGWVGAITAVAGAVIALAQRDLKRVLAGSTSSQLGLMFVGVAAGGPAVGMFHLVTQAAGKAPLFLAAGIFQHARGTVELDGLRGAGREDRATFAVFVVGALSIAAVPPLAGFWSKDAVSAASAGHVAWLVLVLLSAAGSAAYLLRPALVLWQRGPARSEVPPGRRRMLIAAAALVALTVGLGAVGGRLADLVGGTLPAASPSGVALGLCALVLGAGAVLLAPRLPGALRLAALRQLYVDDALRAVVQRPVRWASRALAAFDDRRLDASVDAAGSGTLAFARGQRWIEEHGVDAAVDGTARRLGDSGGDLSGLQSGRLFEYLRDSVIGLVGVAVVVALAALL